MNTPSPAISNSTDLVLQLTGGDRNGQLLPVTTAKCLLSSLIADKAQAEKYRCAIFRGEKGVAFRSYSELVLVNGNKTSVQWLKEGDTIQLTPELSVVVKQLGTFVPTNAPTTQKPSQSAARPIEHTISLDPATGGAAAKSKAVNETPVNSTLNVAPTSGSNETPVAPNQVGQRVDALSDQLTSLVDAASESGTAAATTGLTDGPTSKTPASEPLSDKKMADASSSIQQYLDNALASTGTASIVSPNTTPQSRRVEATVEFPSADSSATENASKLRREEVTSSLNRLLSETDSAQIIQGRVPQASAISPSDQSSTATATASVLSPTPTSPRTVEASDFLNPATESSVATPVEATPVAGTESAQAAESVDAPKAQSLDFLKSLGIDADELGLSDKTPAPESTTSEMAQPEPDVPQETTTSAALPTADEIIASVSTGSVVAEKSDLTVAAEATAEEEAPEQAAAPQKAESVADVLARMQNAGSLDSFSMDEPTQEVSPEPVSVPTQTEVTPPEPQVTETVVVEDSAESKPSGDEDNSVEDYMSQLLNRMRGGDEPKEAEDEGSDAEKPAPVKEETLVETNTVETSKAETPKETLTAEQFVPKQKAVRLESFDSLREIANNSNRLAIQDHLANQRKVSTTTKLQLALISLTFGVIFFAMSCLFASKISIGGLFCGFAFLACGIVFAKYYRDEKKLDESIVQAQSDKS